MTTTLLLYYQHLKFNFMKQFLKLFTVLFLSTVSAVFSLSAQDSVSTAISQECNGHWFIGIQAGVEQTVGETSFGGLISPASSFNFGYQFTPVWGLRVGVSGWQAKGAAIASETSVYKFNYIQGNLDVIVDLCGIFGGYKMHRAVNPYIFAGVGVNGSFNNSEAQTMSPYLPDIEYVWDGTKVFPVGRFGVGMGVRLTDDVHFNIEINGNFISDKFNSKKGSAVDWQLGAQAGFTFKIGMKKKAVVVPSVSEPEPEPEPEYQPQPDHEPTVDPKQEVPVVVTSAFESVTKEIYFTIGRSDIRESEKSKLDEVLSLLKDNPTTSVTVIGHADAETGSEQRNMELSKERAENVAAALEAAGIVSERITVQYKGATENPFSTPEQNRVAICLVAE